MRILGTMPKSASAYAKALRVLIQVVSKLLVWLHAREGLVTWKTSDGHVLFIHEMGDTHLINASRLVMRNVASDGMSWDYSRKLKAMAHEASERLSRHDLDRRKARALRAVLDDASKLLEGA